MASLPRHPSIEDIMKYFKFDHLPEGSLKETSRECYILAQTMYNDMRLDGAELTVGLRKLLEARDCFVRSALR